MKKIFAAYAVLLIIVFASQGLSLHLPKYLLPLYLVMVPLLLRGRINFKYSTSHLIMGLLTSAVVLLPLYFLVPLRSQAALSAAGLLVQLLGISFPEEVFFRGFLQDSLGNDLKAALYSSLLFAVAHLPSLIFSGDVYAPLTFFPSLVMGLLFMKTRNVLAPTIFHFFSNVLFLRFVL